MTPNRSNRMEIQVKVNTSQAATGPGATPTATPRSVEVLVEHVRAETLCLHCLAEPGKPCKRQGRRGVHLARFVHAYIRQMITPREIALVLGGMDVFTAATIIRAGSR